MLIAASRHDNDGMFDAIDYLYRRVMFESDDIKCNSAMIYGSLEIPEVIEFYREFTPTPFNSPLAIWKRGTGYVEASM